MCFFCLWSNFQSLSWFVNHISYGPKWNLMDINCTIKCVLTGDKVGGMAFETE